MLCLMYLLMAVNFTSNLILFLSHTIPLKYVVFKGFELNLFGLTFRGRSDPYVRALKRNEDECRKIGYKGS
jgi:hypothetical protein